MNYERYWDGTVYQGETLSDGCTPSDERDGASSGAFARRVSGLHLLRGTRVGWRAPTRTTVSRCRGSRELPARCAESKDLGDQVHSRPEESSLHFRGRLTAPKGKGRCTCGEQKGS